ncbi:MAG: hypothetical protein WCP07_02160 [bacterium]|jgi:hypothetical protein
MQIVIFRNHLRDDAEDYPAEAAAIGALARAQPGIIGFKTFTAADGERVTIAEFESAEAVVVSGSSMARASPAPGSAT